MKKSGINLLEKFKLFDEVWTPKVIAEINDYQFKLAYFEGEFVWHDHKETDETFLVLEGKITIELEDGKVDLEEGELYVVPKGVKHKPMAVKKSKVLLLEPKGVINTGDSENVSLKAENNKWV